MLRLACAGVIRPQCTQVADTLTIVWDTLISLTCRVPSVAAPYEVFWCLECAGMLRIAPLRHAL